MINKLYDRNLYIILLLISIITFILVLVCFVLRTKKKTHASKKEKITEVLLTIVVLIMLSIISTISIFIYFNYNSIRNKQVLKTFDVKQVIVNNYNIETNSMSYKIKLVPDTLVKIKRYCLLTNEEKLNKTDKWVKVSNDICEYNDEKAYKYIYIKSELGIISKKISVSEYINNTYEIELDTKKVILILGQTKEVKISVISVGNKEILWKSTNESVAKVENNIITATGIGSAKISAESDGITKEIDVIVTNLIGQMQINNNRPFLDCGTHTEEEANLLDQILAYKVDEAGKGTRAGVVAAIRFLSMEFPYKIPYFLENGRTTIPGRYADGEGRFYHEGLYLSRSKFSIIKKSKSGPATWGCSIMEYDSEKYRPNGLDCSGFVSWAILNGGFDIGDYGANGWLPYDDGNDLTYYGNRQYITRELLDSGMVKAGDIASIPGHIALVAGIDYVNQMIYIAEELRYSQGLYLLSLTFNELLTHNDFTHLVLMDNYYKSDGNYINMW